MSESFDEVCASYGDCTWIGRDEVKKVIARLQVAHEHELEQTDKSAYHRGYEDGKKSMDAEHRAMVMRLRRLRFDGDSHANLSKLAYSMYPCATGWTCESCDGLRDELIRLMGGVHDESVPVGEPSGAGCADCDCGAGESGRVMYDELSQASVDAMNKRAKEAYIEHKDDCLTLRDGLGGEMKFVKGDVIINGESLIESLVRKTEELSRQGKVRFPPNADGSLDGLKTVEETAALIDDVRRRTDQSHESSPTRQENEIGISYRTDEPDSQKSPNLANSDGEDGGEVTITADELRESFREIAEHMGVPHDRDLADYSDEAVIDAIYLHIDNYQISIKELQAQVIECCKQRDKARERAINYRNLHHVMQRRLELERDNAKRQCDELQKKLDSARGAVRHVTNQWGISNKKRRELQKKLDAIREALDG